MASVSRTVKDHIPKSMRAGSVTIRRRLYARSSPRRLAEFNQERVVFRHIDHLGLLEPARDGRILEIGPKHGLDSRLLASLAPSELVLLDLPQKREIVATWLPEVQSMGNVRYVEDNLLYATDTDLEALGAFDLVWCLGVLYHNAEQLRLVRRLLDRCAVGGRVVIESATTRGRRLRGRNVVEVHWPRAYRRVSTITHLPSRRAIATWMEMVGFVDVRVLDVYSHRLAAHRAVLTGVRPKTSSDYVSYSTDANRRPYRAGRAS